MLAPPFCVFIRSDRMHGGAISRHSQHYFTRLTGIHARRIHVRQLDVEPELLTFFYIIRGKRRLSSLDHFIRGYLAYVETNRCVETSTTKLFS
jgi:hypothetical protein